MKHSFGYRIAAAGLMLALTVCMFASCGTGNADGKGTDDMSGSATDPAPSDGTDTGGTTDPDDNDPTPPVVSVPEPLAPEVLATATDVTQHGVVPDSLSAAADNTQALNLLIYSAQEGDILYFPAGDYYVDKINFYGNQGVLFLYRKNGLTLYGDGATIINTAYSPTVKQDSSHYIDSCTMVVSECKDITVRNLNFDYYRYVQACGTVTAVSGGYTTVRLDPEFLTDENKPALTGAEYVMAVATLDANGAAITDAYAPDGGYAVTMTGGNYRIAGSFGQVGYRAVARFTLGTYASPTFYVDKTNGLTVYNVTSYSSPSATFYCPAGNADFDFTFFDIRPKTGSAQLWGSNVDGIHIKGLRGALNLTDCHFIGMGDDCLNVHSRAAVVTAQSGNTVTAKDGYENGNLSSVWAKEGDTVEFFSTDFISRGTATVTAVSGNTFTLSAVPAGVTAGDVMENRDYLPQVTVRRVNVNGGRARAFLIQTENVLIENCDIRNLALAAVIVSPDIARWYEMGPSDGVVIRNNTFTNVCAQKSAANYGAIAVKACHDGGGANYAAGVHTRLSVTDNTFNSIGASAVYVSATADLTVTGNTVAGFGISRDPSVTSAASAFAFVNCTEVTFADNGNAQTSAYTRNVSYRD